jgi:hypothetical protein
MADNLALAQAVNTAVEALDVAVQKGWLDQATAKAWLYRFAGEGEKKG